MFVSLWGAQTWRPEMRKNIWSSLLPEKRFVCPCEFFSSNLNCLECWKSPEESFLRYGKALSRPSSLCHARWKLRNWNRSIFKRKHDIELRNCVQTYFKVIFPWMKVKNFVGLPVLNFRIWWRHVKTENWLILTKG